MMDFSEWLVKELIARGWSRSEAARRGGISPSMFDKVINGYSRPGVKFIEGVARAFKMSSAEVMLRVQPSKQEDPWAEEMAFRLSRLSPALRSVAERVIDSMIADEEKADTKGGNLQEIEAYL
jgi:transcriptional regulator with XRE-family HTH domain